jgi:hypothetical protein
MRESRAVHFIHSHGVHAAGFQRLLARSLTGSFAVPREAGRRRLSSVWKMENSEKSGNRSDRAQTKRFCGVLNMRRSTFEPIRLTKDGPKQTHDGAQGLTPAQY